jgi:hypothetical protein
MGVILLVVGTERERVLRVMAGVEVVGVLIRLNMGLEVLSGVPSKPLAFFEGEARILGSMFSESKSWNGSGENARLLDLISSGLPAAEAESS